jgi:serine/threonine protein kinase
MWTTLHNTLLSIHEKHVVHGDVSPKNIIIVPQGLEESKPVLIDFGTAALDGEEYTGVVGTPEYPHIDVLNAYPSGKWCPVAKHDLANLGFTIVVALNQFEIPWESSFHLCSDSGATIAFDKRRVQLSKKLLQKVDKELTTTWANNVK